MCLAAEAIEPSFRTQHYHFEKPTTSFALEQPFWRGCVQFHIFLKLPSLKASVKLWTFAAVAVEHGSDLGLKMQ